MIATLPDDDDGEELRGEVEAAGDRFVRLGPTRSADQLHTELAGALLLPSYYGRNLDALHDVLRDAEPGTVLLWPGWRDLAVADPDHFSTAARLLGERVVLVLPGAGPEDLPAAPEGAG